MKTYDTKYGKLTGIIQMEFYDNGNVDHCMVEDELVLHTPWGELTPKWEYFDLRSKYRSGLTFYPEGNLKSIYLQDRTKITTDLGDIIGEMITFYPEGRIQRLFPSYGKISGYWSEEEEQGLVENIEWDFQGVILSGEVSCYNFYPSGKIKSITFFPKVTNTIPTKQGDISIHLGISFYESGKISSIEPSMQTNIFTNIGTIAAYHNGPIGVHGDENSLKFNEAGDVIGLKTVMTGFQGEDIYGNQVSIYPQRRDSYVDIEQYEMVPLQVTWKEDQIIIKDELGKEYIFLNHKTKIKSVYNPLFLPDGDCSDCTNCSGCH